MMNSIRRCKPLLGTYVELSITAEEDDDTLLDMSISAYDQIERVEELMSFHNSDSELSLINRTAHNAPCPVSAETETVIKQALALSELSDGLYDITIAPELVKRGALPLTETTVDKDASWKDIVLRNGQISFDKNLLIDLGGIAKGYAVDCAFSALPESVEVVINAGGDLRMSHWRDQSVRVRVPVNEGKRTISLPMQNTAIATSANYFLENQNSVILPHPVNLVSRSGLTVQTQQTVTDQNSYSVFAPNCMLADALTKIAFLDPANARLIRGLGAQALMIDQQANITLL